MDSLIDDFGLSDFAKRVQKEFWKTEWVDAYSFSWKDQPYDSCSLLSAFVKNEHVDKILEEHSWDVQHWYGMPGFICHFGGGKEINEYDAYYHRDIFPVVFWRHFPTIKESRFEPLQEFCHYFDLYEDKEDGNYYKFDDCGDKIEVIRILERGVQIKLKFLKEFAAVKESSIVLYFEAMKFGKKSIEELWLKEVDAIVREDGLVYAYKTRNSSLPNNHTSQASILWKKVIGWTKDFKPDLYEGNQAYEKFLIGVDTEGEDLYSTCEGRMLSDYFGKIDGRPNYLTPIFFKREVLKKYFDHPKRYAVSDGSVSAQGLWNLRIDNNLERHVSVFLGDLWWLPHKEQLHWKWYNVAWWWKISHTAYKRAIEGEFTDPEQPDLFFKSVFEEFQEKWLNQFWYNLFLPLKSEDSHYYDSLHSPLSEEDKEFEEQVLALAKILIDSINESEVYKRVANKSVEVNWSIDKLNLFLTEQFGGFPAMTEFLKNLYALRSTWVAHRKGKSYEKSKAYFGIWNKTNKDIFDGILIEAVKTINTLDRYFLTE